MLYLLFLNYLFGSFKCLEVKEHMAQSEVDLQRKNLFVEKQKKERFLRKRNTNAKTNSHI